VQCTNLQAERVPISTSAFARSDSIETSAIHALQSHASVARSTRGTAFAARSVIVDRSGATHVRVDRTFRGLSVLGGDLVIHRGAHGGWAGVSQTLRVPLTLATRPTVSSAAAKAISLRGIANSTVSRARVESAPRLVVDARGPAPRLAWEVYAGARTATLNAAKDLYGAGSAQQNAVAAAWSAVAVN
jgi:Zn-dependent metalloprotease